MTWFTKFAATLISSIARFDRIVVDKEYKCGRGDGIYPIYGTTWSSYSFGDNYTTNPLTWPNCVEEEYFEVVLEMINKVSGLEEQTLKVHDRPEELSFVLV